MNINPKEFTGTLTQLTSGECQDLYENVAKDIKTQGRPKFQSLLQRYGDNAANVTRLTITDTELTTGGSNETQKYIKEVLGYTARYALAGLDLVKASSLIGNAETDINTRAEHLAQTVNQKQGQIELDERGLEQSDSYCFDFMTSYVQVLGLISSLNLKNEFEIKCSDEFNGALLSLQKPDLKELDRRAALTEIFKVLIPFMDRIETQVKCGETGSNTIFGHVLPYLSSYKSKLEPEGESAVGVTASSPFSGVSSAAATAAYEDGASALESTTLSNIALKLASPHSSDQELDSGSVEGATQYKLNIAQAVMSAYERINQQKIINTQNGTPEQEIPITSAELIHAMEAIGLGFINTLSEDQQGQFAEIIANQLYDIRIVELPDEMSSDELLSWNNSYLKHRDMILGKLQELTLNEGASNTSYDQMRILYLGLLNMLDTRLETLRETGLQQNIQLSKVYEENIPFPDVPDNKLIHFPLRQVKEVSGDSIIKRSATKLQLSDEIQSLLVFIEHLKEQKEAPQISTSRKRELDSQIDDISELTRGAINRFYLKHNKLSPELLKVKQDIKTLYEKSGDRRLGAKDKAVLLEKAKSFELELAKEINFYLQSDAKKSPVDEADLKAKLEINNKVEALHKRIADLNLSLTIKRKLLEKPVFKGSTEEPREEILNNIQALEKELSEYTAALTEAVKSLKSKVLIRSKL